MKLNSNPSKYNSKFNPFFDDDVIKEMKKIREGQEPTIITIDGFFRDDSEDGSDWKETIDKYFPNNNWYHLKWKSKNTKESIDTVVGGASVLNLIGNIIPYKIIFNLGRAVNNVWIRALNNSDIAGKHLAEILIENKNQEYILLGHSLGGNVIYHCIKELSKHNLKLIREAHILGGAVNNKKYDWIDVKKVVHKHVYNYYSKNDSILKYMFSTTTFVVNPIGRNRIKVSGVYNVDVTEKVSSHTKFKEHFASYIVIQK